MAEASITTSRCLACNKVITVVGAEFNKNEGHGKCPLCGEDGGWEDGD